MHRILRPSFVPVARGRKMLHFGSIQSTLRPLTVDLAGACG